MSEKARRDESSMDLEQVYREMKEVKRRAAEREVVLSTVNLESWLDDHLNGYG